MMRNVMSFFGCGKQHLVERHFTDDTDCSNHNGMYRYKWRQEVNWNSIESMVHLTPCSDWLVLGPWLRC